MVMDIEQDTRTDFSRRLLRKPEYSDLTITCGDRTWKCHRAILCQRCDFFRVACGGEFEVSPVLFSLGQFNHMNTEGYRKPT